MSVIIDARGSRDPCSNERRVCFAEIYVTAISDFGVVRSQDRQARVRGSDAYIEETRHHDTAVALVYLADDLSLAVD